MCRKGEKTLEMTQTGRVESTVKHEWEIPSKMVYLYDAEVKKNQPHTSIIKTNN